MKQPLLLIFLLFQCSLSHAQAPDGYTYGDDDTDQGYHLALAPNGDYLLTGTTRRNGNNDILLMRLDEYGSLVWERAIGGQKTDRGFWVSLDSEGNILLAGTSQKDGELPLYRFFVSKLRPDGSTLWQKHFLKRRAYCIKELPGGEYGVLGFQIFDAGWGGYGMLTLGRDGEWLATHSYEAEEQEKDYGFEFEITPDGGLLMVGTSWGFHSPEGHDYKVHDSDVFLVKADAGGNEIWRKTLGGPGHDFAKQIEKAPGGGYYIIGSTQSEGAGSFDLFLMKIDEQGNAEWTKTFGGEEFEYGASVAVNSNNEIFLCGTANSYGDGDHPDMFILKTDLDGNEIWRHLIGGDGSEYGHDIKALPDSGCVAIGSSKSFGSGRDDVYLVRLDSAGNFNLIKPMPPAAGTALFSPNPMTSIGRLEVGTPSANDQFELRIFNAAGQLLREEKIDGSTAFVLRNNLAAGHYFYEIILGNGKRIAGKFVVQ
ncbi:MAG TPA: T9SS type A sorting domain-containing protein [Bacteroidetes bacterium]|nr:T9SS type A sorting domain-containing protein [Bacteroidota bacterium]